MILNLSQRHVMGVLNVTPDSFFDGGLHQNRDSALRRAETMVNEGATIIDVGGESTRPGAHVVSADEELERVIPVVEGITRNLSAVVSIDTSKAVVMGEAVRHGAALINDVWALRQEGAIAMAASLDVPVCLMHMQGTPRDMQRTPIYGDVVSEVTSFLMDRVNAVVAAGLKKERVIIDPGFGFGKNLAQNAALFHALEEFVALGLPLLVGVSRKSMIGTITGKDVQHRMAGSVAAATLAWRAGARIIRAHDVAGTVDALRVVESLSGTFTGVK